VAIIGGCGINLMGLMTSMQGMKWTSTDQFFRTLMAIILVEAPRLINQSQPKQTLDLLIQEAEIFMYATALTPFGIALRQDAKKEAQYQKLRFASHQTAARAGTQITNDHFEAPLEVKISQ
jgi:hypothetical protein